MLRFVHRQGREEEVAARAAWAVDAYADLIGRLVRSYLRSTADAEDIAQEVLIKLVVSPPAFKSTEHERAWVIRTTRNACLDLLKSARYRNVVALDELPELPAPEELAAEQDVLAAVDRLPRAYCEAIHLHYYEGLAIAQIAELTGEGIAAITKRLSRARAMLKQSLGGNDG